MALGGFTGALVGMLATLPLVWKWGLGLRRVIVGLVLIAAAAGIVAHGVGSILGLPQLLRVIGGAFLTVAIASGTLVVLFYRDPDRVPPVGEDLVVSPADGEIVYVKRSRHGRLPVSTKHGKSVALEELTRTPVHEGDSIVVGIGMSLLDVHVNRAPIAGRVTVRRHFPGRFGSLRRPEMAFENERATTLIAGRKFEVAVVQIASRLVRQIASYIGEGDEVGVGQRIGAIRLGSQVDVVLPCRSDLQVLVREHDRVEAGTSVIATLTPTEREPAGSWSRRSPSVKAGDEMCAPVKGV